jgi:hypothetical protein
VTVRELADTLHVMMASNGDVADREVVVWAAEHRDMWQFVVDEVAFEKDELDMSNANVVVAIRSTKHRSPRRRGT